MTIEEFIEQRLAADEATARAAVGKRGRKAGDTVQHWRWERTSDDAVADTGDGPMDAAFLYPEDIEPGTYEGDFALRSVERYPTTSGVGQLSDMPLPSVVEPTAAAATHIARHDPARVLRQCTALRALIRSFVDAVEDEMPGFERISEERLVADLGPVAAIWSDHADFDPSWAVDGAGSNP